MWKVFKKHKKKWTKAEEAKLLQLLDSLVKDIEDEKIVDDTPEETEHECSCEIMELMKKGCTCGGK